MRTNFFSTNFLNTTRCPGHPGKIPGTSHIPLFETQGRQMIEGGHEFFGHHPFAWKTPTPPGGLRTQKLNSCARFSCLMFVFPPGNRTIFSTFWGGFLTKWETANLEKRGKIHWRKFKKISSGDGAPKLQILSREKDGRKGAQKHNRKTLIWYPYD